jgi:phosphoserine phosphatase
VLQRRLKLNPGARELTAALKAQGTRLLLVSGGFTFFTSHVKAELGMDYVRSNLLGVDAASQTLTGTLVDQPWGDICDGDEKRRTLLEVASLMGLGLHECMAVGDGANDLPMMRACSDAGGLSVAYCAKPKVREQALVSIESGGLDQLLGLLR